MSTTWHLMNSPIAGRAMMCAWWLIFLAYRTISQLLFGFNIPESVQVLESIVNGPGITGVRDIPNHRLHDQGQL